MLPSLKKEIFLIISVLFTLSLFLFGCDRDTPVEPTDDGRPPAKPTGLRVFREYDGEIGIEWNKNLETDISFYRIFRKTNEINYSLIDSTLSLYYFDTGLEYDSTYFYKIMAVDNSNQFSPLSDSVSGTPENLYSPFPPYYLNINARNWNDTLSIKITFGESFSSDVKEYEVYRSTTAGFEPESSNLIGISNGLNFLDSTDLELLTEYYYKIISVDKGNLRSKPSVEIYDMLLDKPWQVFPVNNSSVDYFAEFKIETCSVPASYKIVLQSNEIYGTEVELNFSTQQTNSVISVPIKNVTFDAYADYYWRVLSYTKNNNVPNSFSDLYKFTIVPGN